MHANMALTACASFKQKDDGEQRSKASCSKLIRSSFHKWSSRSFAWDVYLQFRCPHYLKTRFPYRFLPKFLFMVPRLGDMPTDEDILKIKGAWKTMVVMQRKAMKLAGLSRDLAAKKDVLLYHPEN